MRLTPGQRTRLFSGLLFLLVVAAVETISYAGLHFLEREEPGTVIELFLADVFGERVTPDDVQNFLGGYYDPDLGWVYEPNDHGTRENVAGVEWSYSIDSRGARDGPGNQGAPLIATYGDSFTACVDVSNDETWQSQLAEKLKGGVLNFGVPSYGTLQAMMRMERHFAEGLVAPMTVLGVYESNLGRTVTAYRPFRRPKSRFVLGFRPTLRYRGGIEFFPNPLKDPRPSLSDLEGLASEVADYDYSAETMVRLSYPYTLQIVRLLQRQFDDSHPDDSRIWHTVEGKALIAHLVDRFVHSTQEAGSQPVLLLLPGWGHLREGSEPRYTGFKKEIRQRYPEMTVVDIAEEDFDRSAFNVIPFKGHASVDGNRVIAEALARELKVN